VRGKNKAYKGEYTELKEQLKKVIELLDSMYKEFPIGSFFLWIPPEEYSHYYKDIPELKIQQDNRRFYTHFILDGQQRLTSLYVTHQGLTIDGYDYSNICFDLDTERFNTDPRDNERNLSVHQILNDDQYLQIYNSLLDERKKKFILSATIISTSIGKKTFILPAATLIMSWMIKM